jgi:TonB family protein
VAEPRPPQGKPDRPAVTAHVESGVAIYSVTVEKAGGIGAITLLQSSGTAELDAAGEQMIRRSMMFQPPPGAGDATRYFSVTIRFTPKPR